ncbi:Rieske (2Fe-2S) protein [Neorhizobium sp. DT-125]|uniref:Rieske (2Fe-2S) protein n=1 Tax=Neorhizobium sp. DT-125 TaxID=3396163 RepID=UPI003F199895
MKTKYLICPKVDLPVGERRIVTIKGREIGVFNVKGNFYGMLNRCPHEGAALCKGLIGSLVTSQEPGSFMMHREGEILRCPWHGWEFDIRTGQSYCDPASVFVKQFDIHCAPGAKVVEGPFVAETFTVSSEGEYLYVEL